MHYVNQPAFHVSVESMSSRNFQAYKQKTKHPFYTAVKKAVSHNPFYNDNSHNISIVYLEDSE